MRGTARRVLITGGSGFIGRHVLSAVARVEHLEVQAPAHSEMPCDQVSAVEAELQSFRPTVVVHLAASLDRSETAVGRSSQWRHTFESARNMLDAAGASGVRHVIMAGSLEEGALDVPTARPPASTYGICKLLVREFARHVAANSSTSVDWLRPSIAYGPGQEGGMLLPSVLRAAAFGEEIEVTDGEQVRDFVYVSDLADWIVRCMESGPPKQFETHNVGGSATRVRDIFELIRNEFPESKLRIGARQRRVGEPNEVVIPNYHSVRTPLDSWSPTIDVHQGIHITAEWWRQRALVNRSSS